MNLVENLTRYQNEGQVASQIEMNCAVIEGMTSNNGRRNIDKESNTRRETREIEKRGLTIDMEFQGDVNEEEYVEAILKVTLELVK